MNSSRANRTQKADSPVESPKIFGPMMLPSTCWRIMMKMIKIRHLPGSVSSRRKAEGMAPKKGPKTGMMLVMPTMTLMSMA